MACAEMTRWARAGLAGLLCAGALPGVLAAGPEDAPTRAALEGRWEHLQTRRFADDRVRPTSSSAALPMATFEFLPDGRWIARVAAESASGSFRWTDDKHIEQLPAGAAPGAPAMLREVRVSGDTLELTAREGRESTWGPAREFTTWVYRRAGAGASAAVLPASEAAPAPRESAAAGEPLTVRIGLAAPLSGPIGHLGRDMVEGAQLAIDRLNSEGPTIDGRRVGFQLVVEDDASEPGTAAATAARLVARGAQAVVGHLNSQVSIAAAPVYAQAGIAQLSSFSTHPRYTRLGLATTFRLVPDDIGLGEAMGAYMRRFQSTRSALAISDGSSYGDFLVEGFERSLRLAGGRVVERLRIPPKGGGYAGVVRRIDALKPDTVFYGGLDTEAIHLLRELDAARVDVKLAGGDGVCSADLRAGSPYGGVAVYCAEVGALDIEQARARDFLWQFWERHRRNPDFTAPFVFEAVNLVATAMREAGSTRPDQVLSRLRSGRFEGITGSLRFNGQGELVAGGVVIYHYLNGRRLETGRFPSGSDIAP